VKPAGEPDHGESIVLSRGRLRCPHCEQVGRYPGDFRALDLNEKYRRDLNLIYKHIACGHVFSPGDPWIIQEFLEGNLLPRSMLEDLQQTVDRLQAIVDGLPIQEGRTAA
jgi:hypothetical protein